MMDNSKDDGFYLIWLYWVKKYMNDKIRPKDSIHQVITALKRHYTLEAFDSKVQLDTKLAAFKESKHKQQWPIYLIDPQHEIKLIERNLHEQYQQYRNEIYSYYLNIKNIFIIYRYDWQGSQKLSSKDSFQGRQIDNVSEGNRLYKSMIKPLENRTEGNKSRIEADTSSIINRIFYSCLEYQSSQCRDSLCETVEHKIQDLDILDKVFGCEEFQIWNGKYKHIPHSYLKIKNEAWNKCLALPLMHPSQPKCIGDCTILPQLEPLQPGIDKLPAFVTYLKLLDKYFPGYSPTKYSIFQMNELPIVFSKDCENDWNQDSNVGVLCYYVVYGDDDNLTSMKVDRWAQMNSNTLLGKTIKEMSKRHRERRKAKQENDKKPFSLFQNEQEGLNIW